MAQYIEREITAPVNLCDSSGLLNPEAVGWSRHPLHTCNLRGHWLRKKRWNFWVVSSPGYSFCIALATVDYIGLAFGFFLDYETKELLEHTTVTPFGAGCLMPLGVEEDVEFHHKKLDLSFRYHPGGLRVQARSPSFQGKKLSADIEIQVPKDHETLNVVIPWRRNRFQFTSKQNTLPALGTVSLDDRVFSFSPEDSFACLDFGRGVWPYRTKWNWASGAARRDGNLIGLQFGGKWTDGAGMNENGICFNGKLHKISEDMVFSYDRNNFMEPWTIRTGTSNKVNLKITPFFEKTTRTNFIFLKTIVHQVFGHFSGTVEIDDKVIEIRDIPGWSEEQDALW